MPIGNRNPNVGFFPPEPTPSEPPISVRSFNPTAAVGLQSTQTPGVPAPEGRWSPNLDYTRGNTLTDWTGNNQPIVWVGASGQGNVDYVLENGSWHIQGKQGYFRGAITGSGAVNTYRTVSGWFRLDASDIAGSTRGMCGLGRIDNDTNYMALAVSSSTDILATARTGGSSVGAAYPSAGLDGVWHHYVGMYDPDANESKLYIDGELVDTASGALSNGTWDHAFMGGFRENLNFTEANRGDYDDFQFWRLNLTDQEVRNLYNAGRLTPRTNINTGLQHHWSATLNPGGESDTLFDMIGDADWTLHNVTWQDDTEFGGTKSAFFDCVDPSAHDDGVDGWAEATPGIDRPELHTWSLWTKDPVENTQNRRAPVVMVSDDGINVEDGKFDSGYGSTDGILFWGSSSTGPRTDGWRNDYKWNHWCWTYDGTTIRLYQNGVNNPAEDYVRALVPHQSAVSYLARSATGTIGCRVKLDAIRVYNRALSDSEVAELYAMGRGENYEGGPEYQSFNEMFGLGNYPANDELGLWIKGDEGAGLSVIPDSSQYGVDLKVVADNDGNPGLSVSDPESSAPWLAESFHYTLGDWAALFDRANDPPPLPRGASTTLIYHENTTQGNAYNRGFSVANNRTQFAFEGIYAYRNSWNTNASGGYISSGTTRAVSGLDPINDGTWHQYAVVNEENELDAAADRTAIYIDGTKYGERFDSCVPFNNFAWVQSGIGIGCSPLGNPANDPISVGADGYQQRYCFFTKALTVAEIEQELFGPEPYWSATPPAPSGTAEVGEVLTADTSTIAEPGNGTVSFAYQWIVSDEDGNAYDEIAGEIGATYTIRPEDDGRYVTVLITPSNLGGVDPREAFKRAEWVGVGVGPIEPDPPINYPDPGSGGTDFPGTALEPGWTFTDPFANCSLVVEDGKAKVTFPASGHDPGTGGPDPGRNAVRIWRAQADEDFDVHFALAWSMMQQAADIVGAGIYLHFADGTSARHDMYSNGDTFREYVEVRSEGTVDGNDQGSGAPCFIRLARVGNDFTFSNSMNGTDWDIAATYSTVGVVDEIGIYALNASSNPAFVAEFEYIHTNTAMPTVKPTVTNTLLTNDGEALDANWQDDSANGGLISSGTEHSLSVTTTDRSTARFTSVAEVPRDIGFLGKFRDDAGGSASLFFGIAVRGRNGWQNQYAPNSQVFEGSPGSTTTRLVKSVVTHPTNPDGGYWNYAKQFSATPALPLGPTPTWVRYENVGPIVRCKYWLEGEQEPIGWNQQYVDFDLYERGTIGVSFSKNDGTGVSGAILLEQFEVYAVLEDPDPPAVDSQFMFNAF